VTRHKFIEAPKPTHIRLHLTMLRDRLGLRK